MSMGMRMGMRNDCMRLKRGMKNSSDTTNPNWKWGKVDEGGKRNYDQKEKEKPMHARFLPHPSRTPHKRKR